MLLISKHDNNWVQGNGRLPKAETYWLWNQKSREEVEYCIEEGRDNLGELTVGCKSYHHHSVEGE